MNFMRVRLFAAGASCALLISGCGLFGASETSQDCFESVKQSSAEYVDAARNQPGTSAAGFLSSALKGCSPDEVNEGTSLFVVTIGNAAASFEENQIDDSVSDQGGLGADLASRDALYIGLSSVCVEVDITGDGSAVDGIDAAGAPGKAMLSKEALSVCEKARPVFEASQNSEEIETVEVGGSFLLRYELGGSGRVSVRYIDSTNREVSEQVVLPWVWEGEISNPFPFVSVESGDGVNVSCSIFVGGDKRAEGQTFCTYDASGLNQSGASEGGESGEGGGLVPVLSPEEIAELENISGVPLLRQD